MSNGCARSTASHGRYTIVKDYVRAKTLLRASWRCFVPCSRIRRATPRPISAEALVVIAGVECKAHSLVVDLPHSDDGFVKAFPAETTEAFCRRANAAFGYFDGVPRRIVYDNTKLAVARILGDGTRQRTRVFSELQSHSLFDARFGRPPQRATIKARWQGWSATRAATSSCRSHGSPVGRP